MNEKLSELFYRRVVRMVFNSKCLLLSCCCFFMKHFFYLKLSTVQMSNNDFCRVSESAFKSWKH